jgi:hypothetical protein
MRMFVTVSAFRDPDLPNTLLDCLTKADRPEALHFGVIWQHDDDVAPLPDLAPAKLSLKKVPWRESQGACWARAEGMKLWDGEDWFFQIDSHHRFVQGWDSLLLRQAEMTGYDLPLLTTYASAFSPSRPLTPGNPNIIRFDHFLPEGVPIFNCHGLEGVTPDTPPVRASGLSAHLLFAPGRFVEDVPYDPELYFFGEEVTLAVRAFTWGYNLYHPTEHLMWHESPRGTRPTHWDEHAQEYAAMLAARERDRAGLEKACRLLTMPWVGQFGCGPRRTLAEYEAYAGVNFRLRLISEAARRGDEPPPPPSLIPGEGGLRVWPVRCELDRDLLPQRALDRPAFWYVAFHDQDGREIARQDANYQELHDLINRPGRHIVLERHVPAYRPPVRWSIRPTDADRYWLDGIEGIVDEHGRAIPDAAPAPGG